MIIYTYKYIFLNNFFVYFFSHSDPVFADLFTPPSSIDDDNVDDAGRNAPRLFIINVYI